MIKKRYLNWDLFTKDGTKKLGTYKTKEEAIKREKQINYFKYLDSLKKKSK